MKSYLFAFIALLLTLTSCGINNTSSSTSTIGDTSVNAETGKQDESGLVGSMQIRPTITIGEAVELKFIVRNNADTAMRFLKWETPFEPLISKYLDVIDEDGTQVDYKGAMAKRAMPPPAESYVIMNPGDSLIANINLLKGYAITRPSKYTVIYVSEGMSGIRVRDSVSFVYR